MILFLTDWPCSPNPGSCCALQPTVDVNELGFELNRADQDDGLIKSRTSAQESLFA